MTSYWRCVAVGVGIVLSVPVLAWAQATGRVAWDSVVSVDRFAGADVNAGVGVTLDSVVTARLGRGLFGIVRPRFNRPFGGDWSSQVCQLAFRYEPDTALPVRVELGYLASPVGLGTLRARASDNPTIVPQIHYYESLPPIELDAPPVRVISAVYPFGGQVAVSRERWDLRLAVVDSSATRPRKVFSRHNPPRQPQLAIGGGITPVPELRLGASFMRGTYGRAREFSDPSLGDRTATMVGVEVEYAFRHTRIGGEWVRDWFETAPSPVIVHGWFLEGQQTLSPRWFAAVRATGVNTFPQPAVRSLAPAATRSGEATLGYRLSPGVTARGGYFGRRLYGAAGWGHQVGVSLVWARHGRR